MASSCIRGGLEWILGKISSMKEWSDDGTAVQGCGGAIIPGGVQKMCGCDTSWYGLVGMVVLGGWLDSMILEVFSSLWFYDSICPLMHSCNVLTCLPGRRALLSCDSGARSIIVLFLTYTPDYNLSQRQRGPHWQSPSLRGMYVLNMALHWDGGFSTTSPANIF